MLTNSRYFWFQDGSGLNSTSSIKIQITETSSGPGISVSYLFLKLLVTEEITVSLDDSVTIMYHFWFITKLLGT